ncbi:MAG: hypothetical protein J6X72_00945, partial [Clostridia bacterium]|nr:hypothetical protein [Clostridia bacterium]
AGGTARGGVAGKYSTDALSNVLSITNTNFTITANASNTASRTIGGLVGQVADASPYAPAYISINGTNVITSNGTGDGSAPGGGLVGDAGTGGSFIDVSGNVTVSGRFYAGLVAKLSEGVLRIAGTTDLSAFRRHGGSGDLTAGTIVQTRGRSLIYSLGSGEGDGWVLKRNTSFNNMIDDVNTWGEVLRLDGTTLTESGLFTVDPSAHTVTVNSGVTEINDEAGFAKTALNIQLGTAAGKGALLFQTSNQSATLLGATLTLGADIDLTGTGLTGMTRDDGGEVTIAQNKKVMMPTSAAFTGTFNGNGHTLTVATGEVWGLTSSEAELPASSTEGMIRRHRFIGLFANTDGATFSNLKLNGYYHFILDIDPTFIGGLSAYSTGGLDLTGVTVSGLSFDYYLGASYTAYIGGAVAYALGDGLDVSVTGGSYRPTMTDTSEAGRTSGSAGDKISYVGGVIGFVNEGTGQSIEFDDTTIGITFTKTENTQREPYFGAAIGATSNQAYVKDNRTITLTDVDVMMSANAAAAAGKEYGGILGTSWISADVTIDGVDVVSASITESNSAATNFGGLVHTATGHWDVQDLSVTSANFDVTATGSTFGMIANRAYSTLLSNETALYLELDDANYDIAAVTFTGSTGNFSSFDEVVANTRFNTRDIVRNGNAVVSIKTSGNVVNTTGSQNTYLNKTAYGQSAVGAANPDARYYYNVAHAVTNIGTDPKYNLYAWSVKQYAHSTLSAWFGSPSSTFAGTIDLTGISYYPVDLSANVTFSSATVKLDNIKMEGFVNKGYSGDGSSRTTRSASQHYLMHAALFLNATGDITATGSPAGLKLQGNVPKISNDICGFLVAGTFGGTDNPSPTVLDVTDLVLDGVYVSNGDNHFTDTTYAPLLVNKASRNTTVTLDGVTAPNYGSDLAASSLLGDMGNSTAHGVHLTFTRIVLDGRKSTSTNLIPSVSQALDDAYDTSRSIFSRATLLNSFLYAGESSGTYTFTIDEDWDTSTGDPIHHVTYGYEITTSLEHAGKQNMYSGSTTIFTDPSAHDNDDPDSVYDFTAYFQRYVYVATDPAEYKHELAVNITYSSTISGFGKYNQPFLIDSGEKLKIIAKIIKGDDVTSSVKINLPGDLTGYNYQTTGYGEYLYSFSTSTYTSSDGGAPSMVNANVRRYLAGAYYAITEDITLSSDYEALGQTTAANPEYAFHGVILVQSRQNGPCGAAAQ